jgi:hypothetical protein
MKINGSIRGTCQGLKIDPKYLSQMIRQILQSHFNTEVHVNLRTHRTTQSSGPVNRQHGAGNK